MDWTIFWAVSAIAAVAINVAWVFLVGWKSGWGAGRGKRWAFQTPWRRRRYKPHQPALLRDEDMP